MKRLLIIFSVGILLTGQPALCAELTILTENMPPLNYIENDVLVGPSVEIVKEIQRRLGSISRSGLSLGKGLQNGAGRGKCCAFWDNSHESS